MENHKTTLSSQFRLLVNVDAAEQKTVEEDAQMMGKQDEASFQLVGFDGFVVHPVIPHQLVDVNVQERNLGWNEDVGVLSVTPRMSHTRKSLKRKEEKG
ncbi:hypothetical protein Cadr_000016720 [Camelus dromedarius]|uniref:Uncharacterized protein n=1 Tax=Camelus dromedarius TaxID=9838 RepID=A0A5N4DEV1_CAMDR|nr:hypothetical protein Cadr_000016720 [Camelus dromedarius]